MGFLEVLDESAAVLDESSVSADPDLEDAAFAELVCAPQDEAHAIVIAKQREQAVVASRVMIRSVWKETDAVSVDAYRFVGEQDQFVVILV
jgi:hypothetical protein